MATLAMREHGIRGAMRVLLNIVLILAPLWAPAIAYAFTDGLQPGARNGVLLGAALFGVVLWRIATARKRKDGEPD